MICTTSAKILLLTFVLLSSSFAQNFYVDKNAVGSNNGSTWADAWQSFASINWSAVGPGDVIYISGGDSSKTYYETLNINANGSANNLLTIRNSLSSGHNGRVIIDGGSTRKGILISRNNYIQVIGLETQYCDVNVSVDGSANVIYLDSLGIYHLRGHGGVKINGNSAAGANDKIDSIFVRYCDMVHLDSVSVETDMLYTQYGIRHLFIIGNYIKMKNNHIPSAHNDLMHFDHQTMDITIKDNVIIGLSDGISGMNNNGITAGEVMGDVYIYNNVLYYPTADISGQNVFTQFDDGYESTWYLYSNTFIGGKTINLIKIEDTDCTIKNNIFYNNKSVSVPTVIFRHIPSEPYSHNDWSKIDHNLYGDKVSSNNIVNIGGSGKTMSEFNSLGAETGGIQSVRDGVDPRFIDLSSEEFSLQSGSPAIDEGVTLGAPYNFDIEGVLRPQFLGYDLGAYENSNRSPVLEPIINHNMNEGDSLEIPINSTDPDGDNITLTVENFPAFGTFIDNNNGSGKITFTPGFNQSAVYPDIIVIATDDGLPSFTDTTSFTLTVDVEAIIAPDHLSASASEENEVELSWTDNSNNEDSFIIERETLQTEEYQFIVSIGSNITTYIDTTVLDGQRYNYRVKAINNFTESDYTESVQVVTVLPAPSNLTARVYDSPIAVNLDWLDNSDNELGFVITKKDTITAFFAECDTVGANITTYTDTNVTSTSEYLYKVYAISIDTVSAYSDTAQVIVPVELASFNATVMGNSIHLVWRTVTELNNKGFEIERTLLNPPFIKGGKQVQWETIAFVPGKGTTTKENNYQYIDDYKYKSFKGSVKYRLKQIDFNGTYEYSDIVEVNIDFTPEDFVLYQNYPNPFNPSTKIKYALPDRRRVNLMVYNPIGEVVTVLVDEIQDEGFYEVDFNAAIYKTGIYFYRIRMSDTSSGSSKGFVETKKMILLR